MTISAPSPLIMLMGPTAVGKTALAFELAKVLPVEIISVDSALVYRHMDIGTGKPSPSELASVPHHLIDIREFTESYSAAEFRKDALTCIQGILERKRIPLLVGGTFLYFKALEEGLSPLPSADSAIRTQLLAEAEAGGWAQLHARLAKCDPESAARIHPNDTQRIQRALEVYEISGKPMSHFLGTRPTTGLENYRVQRFALIPKERKALHDKIVLRFQGMLKQGLIEEVETLRATYSCHLQMPAMRAVGYRQVFEYLEGHYSYESMVEKAVSATRQLAKRQMTWLRSLDKVHCLVDQKDLDSIQTVLNCVS